MIEYTINVEGVEHTYRLITSLIDIALFPALLLSQEYHKRWEIEITIDEFKTHLNGRKTPIRSLKPREVVQEIYGWLIAHYAVRALIFHAASEIELSPLRIGFTGSLKVIKRAIPDFQDLQPEQIPFFLTRLIIDLFAEKIPTRKGINNPRVVKKTRSKYPAKKPKHSLLCKKHETLSFAIVKAT